MYYQKKLYKFKVEYEAKLIWWKFVSTFEFNTTYPYLSEKYTKALTKSERFLIDFEKVTKLRREDILSVNILDFKKVW